MVSHGPKLFRRGAFETLEMLPTKLAVLGGTRHAQQHARRNY